jgi:hypothetical protein
MRKRPERYRIACLYENRPPRDRQLWRRWPELFPVVDPLIKSMPSPCSLRSVQYDPLIAGQDDEKGSVTRFRKLSWSDANNRRWVDDLAERPGLQLEVTEIWSPWRKDLEDRRGGPHLYIKIDSADETATEATEFDWQSLTVAIHHDVLADTAGLAQMVLEHARPLMVAPRLVVFDRGWAERGSYTSTLRVNGLEDSHPAMLERWARAHPQAVVPGFEI